MLSNARDVERLIAEDADMRTLLQAVDALRLPDALVSAGFVRNAVWDVLHGRSIDCRSLRDVDVAYFEPTTRTAEQDDRYEAALQARVPWALWEVKNQARMHERNGDAPYLSTTDAISQYPETATALGARWVDGRVELVAPLGIDDLLAMIVRPTPRFRSKLDIYQRRQAEKNWSARWPLLRVAAF